VILVGWSLLLVHSPRCEAKSDLERFDLHGAVRTVVIKYPQLTTTQEFDREGHLTSLELLPARQAVGAVRYVYMYDESGRLTEEESFEPDGSVASRKWFRYGIDDQGRPSAQVAVTEQGRFAQAEFSFYDRRGLLSEEIMVTAQGVTEKILFDAAISSTRPVIFEDGINTHTIRRAIASNYRASISARRIFGNQS
jgi:hypothetical protein